MRKYKGFFNLHQMQMYLMHSVIRLDEKPIYITDIEEQGERNYLYYCTLGKERKSNRININSAQVNFNPVPLGLINNNGSIAVVSRSPARMWKIGLHNSNTHWDALFNEKRKDLPDPLLLSDALRKTIENVYPTLAETIKQIQEMKKAGSIAFNRHFCLAKGSEGAKIRLFYYKFDTPVGVVPNDKPVLFNVFKFLEEHLRDELNG